MDIDMCIRIKHRQCTTVIWKYTRFFCGNEKFCEAHDDNSKKKAAEYSKQRLAIKTYISFLLETNTTIQTFERLFCCWYS